MQPDEWRGNPILSLGGQKGLLLSDRKWMIRLAGKLRFPVVRPEYLLRSPRPLFQKKVDARLRVLPKSLKEEKAMVSLRTLAEVIGIFTVSMIVLFVLYTITGKRATGIGWVRWKGYVLMGVGVLYLVFGAILTRLGR
jgi:hypothetical protein